MRNPTQLGICHYAVLVRVSALKENNLFLKLCLMKMLISLCKLKLEAYLNLKVNQAAGLWRDLQSFKDDKSNFSGITCTMTDRGNILQRADGQLKGGTTVSKLSVKEELLKSVTKKLLGDCHNGSWCLAKCSFSCTRQVLTNKMPNKFS